MPVPDEAVPWMIVRCLLALPCWLLGLVGCLLIKLAYLPHWGHVRVIVRPYAANDNHSYDDELF